MDANTKTPAAAETLTAATTKTIASTSDTVTVAIVIHPANEADTGVRYTRTYNWDHTDGFVCDEDVLDGTDAGRALDEQASHGEHGQDTDVTLSDC